MPSFSPIRPLELPKLAPFFQERELRIRAQVFQDIPYKECLPYSNQYSHSISPAP